MPRITLLYFDGCPNWQHADANIRAAIADRGDIHVDYQLIETPEQAEQIGFVGSPTVLIDGLDPFAQAARPAGLTCRIYHTPAGPAGSPTVDQLVHALAAAEHAAGQETADSGGFLLSQPPPRRGELMFKRRASRTTAVPPSPGAGHDVVATLTDADFARGLAGGWTVVYFWAPWCGPCRQFAPRFERAATTHGGPLQFARCNVDTERLAAAQFGIVSIPTLGLFDPDGQLRDRLIGAPSSPALVAFLSQVPHDTALPAD